MANNRPPNSIFSGLFWKFSERILSQGIAFGISVILARLLSPDDYGIIAIVMIFMNLADVFVVSGFSTALIQKRDADSVDFSTMFYCSFLCSLVIYGVLFAAAPLIADFYHEPVLVKVVRVFALRIPLSAYYSIQQAYVARHMMFQRFFYSTLSAVIFSGAAGIVMAYMGFGVWALIAQYLANTIVGSIVLTAIVPWRLERKFSPGSAKRLMRYGWKVFAADFSGTFFSQLRGLIIGRIYTTTDLAYYDKGQQLPTLISSNVSATVMSVLFPAIANLGDDLEQVKQMAKRAVRLMSYIIFPLMAGLAVVAKPLVLLLFTEKWQDCIPFVRLLCVSAALDMLGTISLQAIKAIGRSDVLLKIEFVKKPVYLLLLLLGVQISVYATAVTLVVSCVYAVLINMRQLEKYLHYSILEQLRDVLPAFLLSASMALVVSAVLLLRLSNLVTLLAQVALGIVYYMVVSWLLKVDSFTYLLGVIRAIGKGTEQAGE